MSMFNQLYDMHDYGGPQFELYFRNRMLLLVESRGNEPPSPIWRAF
jgi:hypothetical protein